MLGVGFLNYPATEAAIERQCNLRTPLNKLMVLNHATKLDWADAKLVQLVLELFKLLIDDVHDILLALRRISLLAVMLIFA